MVVFIRLDLLKANFQTVNDLRMLQVEIVSFPEILFQVVESELSKTDDFGEKQSQTQFRRIGRERR